MNTTLEEQVQKLVRAQGSPSKVRVTELAGDGCMKASINDTNKEIKLEIPEGWNPEQYERIANYARKIKVNTKKAELKDIPFHEIGHDRLKNDKDGLGCPEDMHGKEVCVDATARALREEGKYSLKGALYLENAIADIIDNTNCSQYTKHHGMAIFFAEQAEMNRGRFSPLYEAFVKLNMQLWGTRQQKKLMAEYYTNQPRIDEAVQACLHDAKLTDDKKSNLGTLFDKSRWPETFYTFAKHLAQFMDATIPEMLPGSGSGGKGYEAPEQFGEEGEETDPEDINDGMMRRILDPETLKKIMMQRNQEGMSPPAYITNWRALNAFYDGLASEIIIKAESPKKGVSMPVAPIQARPFDEEKDRIEDILFGKILFDDDGHPCLAVPRSHLEYHARMKKTITSYPDLNIALLDCSTSMLQAANTNGRGRTNIVPWGDNSKYHYGVLTYKGVEKALHRLGVGIRSRYQLITFGKHTRATGEKTHEEKDTIIQKLLSPTFENDTQINMQVLRENAWEPGSLFIAISDGAIGNWRQKKDEYKAFIRDKHYVHFHIGPDTDTVTDLESWGVPVVRIDDAATLPKNAIDITRKFYTSYAGGQQ